MLIDENDEATLMHYGILRRSGRYPWGSGGNSETPVDRAFGFQAIVKALKKDGVPEAEIAAGFGMSINQLRDTSSIATNVVRSDLIGQIRYQQEQKGLVSPTAIAKAIYGPGNSSKESVIRGLMDESKQFRAQRLAKTADLLRTRVEEDRFIDVGRGSEHLIGVPKKVKDVAVAVLLDEDAGYALHPILTPTNLGNDTTTNVLAKADFKETFANRHNIKPVTKLTENPTVLGDTIQKPIAIDPSRLQVIYGKEGAKNDGVFFVRPGSQDLDMGGATYVQARIQVGPKHYLKGMAVQKTGLPDGVDIQFNTPKKDTGDKLDALKPLKGLVENPKTGKLSGAVDKEMPFGSTISKQFKDEKGRNKSAVNVVNDEDNWDSWSKSLSSQMLSKQKPEMIKSQLDVTYANKRAQLEEIKSLTNPAVKRKLLESFSDDLDAAAIHMKAAALPRQETKVILPINSLKPTEIYAPTFKDGERVALIRYPHSGVHEIPELVVNNSNREGKALLGGTASAAVGIHFSVANKLSGADFDGDTVVVIPNNSRRITTASTKLAGGKSKNDGPLAKLQDFDTKDAYGPERYAGVKYPLMTKSGTQTAMGLASNLITDMNIRGADDNEMVRAVRHSMVVIDAEKHKLNYQQSYIDNGIAALRVKYQKGLMGGANTIVSVSTGGVRILDERPARVNEGGRIDPKTGELRMVKTGKTYNKAVKDSDGNIIGYEPAPSTTKVAKGSQVKDARDLVGSNSIVEKYYADYSNSVRSLANEARLEMLATPKMERSPSARKAYASEVQSLEAKLRLVEKKAPVERSAQRIAKAVVKAKQDSNPDMTREEKKKLNNSALKTARQRLGLSKLDIEFSTKEWEAIQAGAVSENRLKQILAKANMTQVQALATPKTKTGLSTGKLDRARALLKNNYTLAEVADELGVSPSTLSKSLKQ